MPEAQNKNTFAFSIITSLFFLWGFTTVNNDILIPYYQTEFDLSSAESMLINLSFFGSYGIWALLYFLYSKSKGDPILKIGYKNGVIIGLGISAFACALYYPITTLHNYYLALIPLFLLGMGFTMLQISCNPYVSMLGNKDSASARLNLSQGFNSLGTTIGPMLLGFLILSYFSGDQSIQIPYLILAVIFALFAIVLLKLKLPEPKLDKTKELVGSALQFSHLRYGMIAIFFYVGAEVAIGSKLLDYVRLPEIGNIDDFIAPSYIGLYWGGAMIGRLCVSVISSKNYGLNKKLIYGFVTSLITFVFLLIVVSISMRLELQGIDLHWQDLVNTFIDIYPILFFILAQYLLMLFFRNSSRKLLSVFACVIILLLLVAFFMEGKIALWSMISIGLFNSIMWSNIFTLSIEDLGEYTSQASSLLVIMIIGGAIIPLLMGFVIDAENLQVAYLIPIISYLYILFFGLAGSKTKTTKHE